MNKLNFFYPVTRGGLIPSATIRVPNNHADNFHISVNSGFILDEHPFQYYYDIDVNGFNFVSRRVINGFIEDNTMNNFIVNMTSNFTFNDVYPNSQYTFRIRIFDSMNNELDHSETTVYLVGDKHA